MPSEGSEDGREREDCWFLQCTRDPEGDLYGDGGFAVAACERHGLVGEAYGWDRFERYDDTNTDSDGGGGDAE